MLDKMNKKKLIMYLEREVNLLKLAQSLDQNVLSHSYKFEKISKKKKQKILKGGNRFNIDIQGLKKIYNSIISRTLTKYHEKTSKLISGGEGKIDLKKIFDERLGNLNKHSCSIARTNLDGTVINQSTCYSKESLLLLANYWNENHQDQIKVDKDSHIFDIHSKLDKKMEKYCPKGNEICWAAQQWVKDSTIKDKTFRGTIPKGKEEWLSTLDIDYTMNQFQDPYFYFTYLGSYAIDFESYENKMNNFQISDYVDIESINLENTKTEQVIRKPPVQILGMVLNLDKHDRSGSHWVALSIIFYRDRRIPTEFSYFDSTSCKDKVDCPPPEVKSFYQKVKKQLQDIDEEGYKISGLLVNEKQTQFGNSECGMYSMRYLIMRIHLFTFEEACNNILHDEEMNNERKNFFRKDNGYDTSENHLPIYRYERMMQR